MGKPRSILTFVLALLLVLAIFAGGLWLGYKVPRWLGLAGVQRIYGSATVLQQVQTLSELVTVKYVMEKVVILEDVKWYGENRVLLLAHGISKAGVDLKPMTAEDISVQGKTIQVRLPAARITDAYLDEKETKIVDRTTGLLRLFDKDLEQTARQNAISEIRRSARESGILKDADERARTQIRLLLLQMGFEQVEITTK